MPFPLPGTKGRLVEAALNLFSRHGYNAVSVRDIAREVGIKDSSIYSHFASKDALLEEIIGHFRREFLSSIPRTEDLDKVFDVCPPDVFFEKGFTLFQKRVEDPLLARTYLVLMRERHDDNRAAEAWRNHEETVVAYVAQAFRLLMARGQMSARDPEALAALYEYPLLHLIGEYIPLRCRGEDTRDVEVRMARHREFFFRLLQENPHDR